MGDGETPQLKSPQVRALTSPSTLLLVAALGALLLSTRWVTFNAQGSVPYGFYRLVAVPSRLERGMLVILWPPRVTSPWHPWWLRMLKPIAALPGDQVCILSAGLWVNGEPYGPVLTEAHGKALPRLRGCFAVHDGEVLLATQTVRTLDGRYFGVVPVSALTAQALPLWTWR